jgi:phosphatidylinositol alpha-1,6-mannosyltransferase
MKFILFTLEYPPFKGGVANYYYNLVKHAPKEHEVFVLDNNKGKLNNSKTMGWLKSFGALVHKLKKLQVTPLRQGYAGQASYELQVHIIVGQILPLGTVTWILSYIYKFKYTVVLHGMDIEYAQKYQRKKWLAKKILGKASTIICNSAYVAELVENFIEKKHHKKIHVVNPGVERMPQNVKHETRNKINKNNIVLFSLGRLVKRKGFDNVIKAMPDIVEEVPNLEYYIAGIGPDENFLKQEKEKLDKNIQKHIHFLGKVSDAEKWQYLRKCDIFIMPNREIKGDTEGFGIVFIEANLAGKPVIGGEAGGTGDAILDHETGILVNGESVDEIADAVILLSRNFDKRLQLGDYGMKRAIACFRWEDRVNRFYKIISNI